MVHDISSPIPMTWHPLYLCHHTQCIFFIKPSVHMTSPPLYVWHHMHCIWHHIHPLWHHNSLFFISSPLYLTSHPLYLTSRPLYLSHHPHPIDDISPTIYMISHPLYVWHPIHYISDIILYMYDLTTLCVDDTTLGIFMTSFAPQKMSHPLYHTKPQYLWRHVHFRHDMTPTVSESNPLYLCHHSLSMDTTPTFVWHQTHYMCDIICPIYNIITTPYIITLLYLQHHKFYIWNYIQYIGQHIPYPCDIRAAILCHHTHYIDITPNLCMTSHSPYVWHLLHYIWHHILTLWHQTTIFLTSHPLYLISYPLNLSHHLHCLMISHQMYL